MAKTDSVMVCDKGTETASLVASGKASVKICGVFAAVLTDVEPGVNISPFGICTITQSLCSPVPVGFWKNPFDSGCIMGGVQGLLKNAKLHCDIGGTISLMSAEQASVLVGRNLARLLVSGPLSPSQYLRELFEGLGNEKVLDRLGRATPDELRILYTILSLDGGREHVKDVLSGAAIWIQDAGDLAGKWSRLPSFYHRTSSHKHGWFNVPLSTTGAVNGPLSRTILFGTVGAPGHHAYTWVQLEGSPGLKNPVHVHRLPGLLPLVTVNPRTVVDDVRHGADYVDYKHISHKNQGPYGSSVYTDHNPLFLVPRNL